MIHPKLSLQLHLMQLTTSFRSVQSLSCVRLFVTTWTAARQASLSITNSQSLLKFMSIELVMPSNHLILCCPLLLPTSIFSQHQGLFPASVLCIRWPKYWSFSISISIGASASVLPMNMTLWTMLCQHSWQPPLVKCDITTWLY